jgi:hypothetical protein
MLQKLIISYFFLLKGYYSDRDQELSGEPGACCLWSDHAQSDRAIAGLLTEWPAKNQQPFT